MGFCLGGLMAYQALGGAHGRQDVAHAGVAIVGGVEGQTLFPLFIRPGAEIDPTLLPPRTAPGDRHETFVGKLTAGLGMSSLTPKTSWRTDDGRRGKR